MKIEGLGQRTASSDNVGAAGKDMQRSASDGGVALGNSLLPLSLRSIVPIQAVCLRGETAQEREASRSSISLKAWQKRRVLDPEKKKRALVGLGCSLLGP